MVSRNQKPILLHRLLGFHCSALPTECRRSLLFSTQCSTMTKIAEWYLTPFFIPVLNNGHDCKGPQDSDYFYRDDPNRGTQSILYIYHHSNVFRGVAFAIFVSPDQTRQEVRGLKSYRIGAGRCSKIQYGEKHQETTARENPYRKNSFQ